MINLDSFHLLKLLGCLLSQVLRLKMKSSKAGFILSYPQFGVYMQKSYLVNHYASVLVQVL